MRKKTSGKPQGQTGFFQLARYVLFYQKCFVRINIWIYFSYWKTHDVSPNFVMGWRGIYDIFSSLSNALDSCGVSICLLLRKFSAGARG